MTLSVAIITLNEERNLDRTLKSVKKFADEIVIVDSGSIDKTEEIAKKYNAKFYYQKWLGYGEQRNKAIEYSSGDWILNIDADEEISEILSQKIISIKNASEHSADVYKIRRVLISFGKEIKYGGWSNNYAVRLFKRNTGKFDKKNVHEEFETDLKILKIKEHLYHHSYSDLDDYLKKENKYTTLGAMEYYKKGRKTNSFLLFLNALYKFIQVYIVRLGFLDGVEGLLLACTKSYFTMVKYYKLKEIYKNKSYIE